MKLIFGVIACMFFAAGNLNAAEYKGNPDRFPSIGISFGSYLLDGDATATAGVLSASQDVEITGVDLTFDARVPVSDTVTVTGVLTLAGQESDATETFLLSGAKTDLSGHRIRVGARFYLK